MKSLAEQFKNLKAPKGATKSMDECYALNNYYGFKILQYIVANKCKLEHRTSMERNDWQPGTLREFLHSYAQAYMHKKETNCFDSWTLNFWRIKTKPTEEEIEALTVIENNKED